MGLDGESKVLLPKRVSNLQHWYSIYSIHLAQLAGTLCVWAHTLHRDREVRKQETGNITLNIESISIPLTNSPLVCFPMAILDLSAIITWCVLLRGIVRVLGNVVGNSWE